MGYTSLADIINGKFDHVIVNISGGKDSTALILWALWNFPNANIILVHAEIDIDWAITLPIVNQQAAHFDLPLTVVRAIKADGKKSGFIRQLLSERVSRSTGEVGEYSFPDMSNRWCTSMLKTGPIEKYIRTLKGSILNLLGERREESNQRAKLEMIRPNEKLSKNGRNVVTVSPLLDLKEDEIWKMVHDSGAPVHPCYSWGVSRASCAICIFSSAKDIRVAWEHEPDMVLNYIHAESQISHSFRYKPATKKRDEIRISVLDLLLSTFEGEEVPEELLKLQAVAA